MLRAFVAGSRRGDLMLGSPDQHLGVRSPGNSDEDTLANLEG